MENISSLFQLIVAISVLYIWIFRYDNIVAEFKHFGYSDLVRNFVGATKISISTLLIVTHLNLLSHVNLRCVPMMTGSG